jgi:aldehyde:ferredoxin oxidoreductase
MGGYMGKLAWIDLSAGTVKVEEIAEDVRRKHIGGTGFASYILRQFPVRSIRSVLRMYWCSPRVR